MFTQQPKRAVYAKQAKIVKLNRLGQQRGQDSVITSQNNKRNTSSNDASFDSTTSSLLSSSFLSANEPSFDLHNDAFDATDDVSGEFLTTQLYVIRDYHSRLDYGDLSVRRGELVYLICDLSELYYLVENMRCQQGFVPKDVCINLEETIRSAQQKLTPLPNCKITSL
jgi:hypothetical protein